MRFGPIALGAAFVLSAPLNATPTFLHVKGHVNYISALKDLEPTEVPPGQIASGDEFELRATFEVDQAVVGDLFNADPKINIYSLPGALIWARIGSYTTQFSPGFSFNATAQLWDNYDVTGPVDAQSFNFFNYRFSPVAGYAFDVGSGSISENLTFNAFDFTAQARSNDLISQLVPLSAFGSKSLDYGLLNADTQLFVYVGASIDEATLGVPEPKLWAAMIVGMGMIGVRLRRRESRRVSWPQMSAA